MTATQRDAELRQMLLDHRRQLEEDLHARLRAGRAERPVDGRDDMEQSDDGIRGELSFALLQLKSEALSHLAAALARLDAGRYGQCVGCDTPIPTARLKALPFAVRCQPCAGRRERHLAADATARVGPRVDVSAPAPA